MQDMRQQLLHHECVLSSSLLVPVDAVLKTTPLKLKYLTYTVLAFSSRRFMVHKDKQRTHFKSEEIKDGISKKKLGRSISDLKSRKSANNFLPSRLWQVQGVIVATGLDQLVYGNRPYNCMCLDPPISLLP